MRRNLFSSIADQAVVSIFNFSLNIYLIKLWTPENFGFFVIIAAISIFATMIQNAVVNTPIAVHLPIAVTDEARALLLRVFSTANLLLTLLLFSLSFGALSIWLNQSQLILVTGASLYITTQFLREYHRALLAVKSKLGLLLAVDIAYISVAVGVLSYIQWSRDANLQTVAIILLVLSASGLITLLPLMIPRTLPTFRNLPKEMIAVFGQQKHEIRWSLLGVLTTDIQNRGYLFAAAAVFGPATVAHLQAGRIFFGPLNLLTGAWARVARPHLSGLLGKGDIPQFNRSIKHALVAFVAFNIVFLAALWAAWPYLSATVFGDKYKGLGLMIAAWGVANIAFQVRSCLSIGVQALRRFRDLTMATIFGAIVSLVLVALACSVYQPIWLIASVIGGECVAIFIVIRILQTNLLTLRQDQ